MADQQPSTHTSSQVPLGDILHTAQNLVSMLSNTLSVGQPKVGNQSNISVQSAEERRSKSNVQSVQQEMARSFPGFFRKEVRGKKRFGPYKRPQKTFLMVFFLLDQQYEKTPKGETELQLTLAGLGRRSLTITENMTHSELSEVLVNAYPKLAKVCGGWLLHKCSGGGGQRKLTVIPPDPDGYNGQQLKTVSSNGKSTMYVVPLQEQIDITPLPPDAREFEKMPKAQCALCSKMVPLQCLPELEKSPDIESCDSNINEVWTEKTAECPLCKKSFDSDVIEIHAANCGLRTAEYDDNVSDPINTQSSGEILNWIASKVDQTNTFSICISRNDIYNRGMQQWQRQKKSTPKDRLKVTFFGEAGVDSGALSKEFLTEMIAEIETRLFIAGVDKKGKNPVYCLNSLDRNYFRSAGEIMTVSLAQGGPPPVFLRAWCFQYLCTGDYDSIQVTTSDVTDLEFSLLIEKVNSTDDMSEFTDEILSCGYTGKVSADMKSNIIRAIVLHSTMRVVPMLDQLRKGLKLYDLQKVMEMHPDLCLPLFVPGEKDDRMVKLNK
ncbi:uncharacterized protein LOC130417481 [Triplophysa dalaica]|uniref:uncharacterized protein LOC130417481 n=1 Tax=Triplophysa dalaica TaxID=1582913 RepID=UPI0024DFDAA8|nr:uncharacterized protein LOC130417481 [Triplophysa dalaica]